LRQLRPGSISREDALNLAAWLVALADPEMHDFSELLERVVQGEGCEAPSRQTMGG
jgi:hypothetical protein